VLTVVLSGRVAGGAVVDTGLFVRMVSKRVVIDRDSNSKPPIDALLQAGVPDGLRRVGEQEMVGGGSLRFMNSVDPVGSPATLP